MEMEWSEFGVFFFRKKKQKKLLGKPSHFLLPKMLPMGKNKKDASMSALDNCLISLEENGARSRT